jgi:hypothetical protein
MEVKGVVLKSNQNFVKDKYPKRYKEWFDALSDKAKSMMSERIVDDAWYNINEAMIEPTKKICDLFYKGSDRGAWEIGRYAAEYDTKGVYSFFLRVASPVFFICRASNIISNYYRPCEIEAGEIEKKQAYMHILSLGEPNHIVEMRIGGWVERILELCGCKNLQLIITKSLTKGDKVTEYKAKWD